VHQQTLARPLFLGPVFYAPVLFFGHGRRPSFSPEIFLTPESNEGRREDHALPCTDYSMIHHE
jgi:hypothetical protein